MAIYIEQWVLDAMADPKHPPIGGSLRAYVHAAPGEGRVAFVRADEVPAAASDASDIHYKITVIDNEDPADPSVHEPRVTGAPETIWLVYGELEHDDTHANCADSGEVTWCEDAQFPTDVRYRRADLLYQEARQIAARALEDIANEPPVSGNDIAQARVLLAAAQLRGAERKAHWTRRRKP